MVSALAPFPRRDNEAAQQLGELITVDRQRFEDLRADFVLQLLDPPHSTVAGVGEREPKRTSVGGAERVRGIPHFDTKWEIEKHLRSTGLPATVLRPTTFMDVFTMRGAAVGLGMMAAALGPAETLQMIAVRDIGVFAVLAFEQPESFAGKAIELAGDELTVPEIAETLRGAGRSVRYLRLPRLLLRAMGKETRMLFWFGESGYQADIPALRESHPGLLTLRDWLGTARETA